MKQTLLLIPIISILFGYQTSIEERLYKLNRELMCPICEGLTLEQSQSRLNANLNDARNALMVLSESVHRDALLELTRFLAQQSAGLGVV